LVLSQALDHAGFATRQVGVRTSPTKQLLEAQQHKSQQLAYQTGAARWVGRA
jgi:hypothetical protein